MAVWRKMYDTSMGSGFNSCVASSSVRVCAGHYYYDSTKDAFGQVSRQYAKPGFGDFLTIVRC